MLPDHMAMGSFRNRVMRFAFNPERPEEMFAALEVRGVIRSTDGGENWQDCSDHLIRLAEQPHLQSAILTTDIAEGMLDVHAIASARRHQKRRLSHCVWDCSAATTTAPIGRIW